MIKVVLGEGIEEMEDGRFRVNWLPETVLLPMTTFFATLARVGIVHLDRPLSPA